MGLRRALRKLRRRNKRKSRSFRRYRSKTTRSTGVQRNTGFSKQQVVKLRFIEHYQDSVTGPNAVIQRTFRANGPFDPDTGAFAGQPKAFAFWASIYNEVMVIGSKITVTAIGVSTTPGSGSGMMTVQLSDVAGGVATTMEQQMNDNKTHYKQIPVSGSVGTTRLSHAYGPKTFFGIKDPRDNIKTMGSLVSTVPSEQAYYKVVYYPTDPSSTGTVSGPWTTVQIDYICLFTGPVDINV